MPGELSDPTQMFPFHYDERYDPGQTIFQVKPLEIDDFIQLIAESYLGKRLSPERMEKLKDSLNGKGYLHRNPGDEDFQEEVKKQIKLLKTAQKVVRSYARIE